jgi:hypothetical protein
MRGKVDVKKVIVECIAEIHHPRSVDKCLDHFVQKIIPKNVRVFYYAVKCSILQNEPNCKMGLKNFKNCLWRV